jgi:hypothetical protein
MRQATSFFRSFWSIKYINTKEFPHRRFPIVFLNGQPGFVITQWIHYLLENGIAQSLLEERIRAVLHLFDFTMAKYGERALTSEESRSLVHDFLLAKKRGTSGEDASDPLGLGWKPLPSATVRRYLAGINTFDKWQSGFHNAARLNPSEERFLNAWETYRDFQQRTKWDPMLHLFPAKRHTKEVYRTDLTEDHARFWIGKRQFPKAFPLRAFVDLVERCPNVRDKMLWLLLFGIALRQSEPLHLYLEDCFGATKLGETRIRLDDPERGEFEWVDAKNKQHRGTRARYLVEVFQNPEFKDRCPALHNLAPRTQYGRRGGNQAGFKGMTFDTDSGGVLGQSFGNEAHWIDPRLGVYFQTCLKEYLHEHFYGKPSRWPFHPFLFIQLDKETYGLPLTLPALKKAWHRALSRIRVNALILGPHSLRHLAGYYCASVLKLPIETTKSLLRHGSVVSTECYYHLSSQEVRTCIIESVTRAHGLSVRDYVVLPDSPRLELPPHWAPGWTAKQDTKDS